MNVIPLPLADIRRPERNVRIHTEKQIKEFGRSVTMFGQIRPIVIDEDNTILAGVGLYETLLSLGKSEGDFYRVTGLSENQKKKLMIADNKIFGLGVDNLDAFNTFLDELQNDLDIPGYDEDILRSMVAAAEEVSQKISEYGTVGANDIAEMEAARGKKDAIMESSARETDGGNPSAGPPADGEAATDINRYVVCPKCGEKVWL